MTRAKDISKIVTDADLSGTLDVTGEVNLSANLNLGDNDKAIFGAGDDLQIYHDGSNSYIDDVGTGSLIIRAENLTLEDTSGNNYLTGAHDGEVRLYYINSQKLAINNTGIDVTGVITTDGMTTSADINFGDNDKAVFGAGSDLQIYHDGSNSYIAENGTGQLYIQATDLRFYNSASNIQYLQANDGAEVILYYNNAQKLATTSTGIDVTGNVDISSGQLDLDANYRVRWGASNNYSIMSDNANYIQFNTAGSERMRINSSGNVGIGMTNSNVKLAVNDPTTNAHTTNIKIVNNAGWSGSIGYLKSLAWGDPNNVCAIGATFDGSKVDMHFHSFYNAGYTTETTKLMTILGSGNVGIGTSSPTSSSGGKVLAIETSADEHTNVVLNTANVNKHGILEGRRTGRSGTERFAQINLQNNADKGEIRFYTAPSSSDVSLRMTIDSDGNVGIGGTPTNYSDHKSLALFGATGTGAGFIEFNDTSGNADSVIFADNGHLIINADYDNTAASSTIRFRIDGSSEKMRIDTNGNLLVGTTTNNTNLVGSGFNSDGFAYHTRSGGQCLVINRQTDDGVLIDFRQDNTGEGNISVSGTTVSYNGGHLSRWSQLADNTRNSTILKGTVMTNLDQMAEWTTDGITEDNEQLNCMAVSSVEGDANVAGVFVNWDNDDDIYTNDMNIAMTGDMVIRIAQGTTVTRGDLLMSAGDGTAKPQGDDIVRSKTIAKVTSTNVSNTYDDGTYLVPCVLMAC